MMKLNYRTAQEAKFPGMRTDTKWRGEIPAVSKLTREEVKAWFVGDAAKIPGMGMH